MRPEMTGYQLACKIHDDFGVPVFPVLISQSDTGKWNKKPLVKWSQVSGDPRELNWAGANAVGVPTGQRSGLLVIDLDDYKPGSEARAWVDQRQCPATRVHGTTSGGQHWIYRLPAAVQLGNRASIVPGLDTRGNGGFIVWGDVEARYRVLDDRMPTELPKALCEELRGPKANTGSPLSDARLPDFGYVSEDALDAKLARLLAHPEGAALRARFEGGIKGLTDTSASGRDMSVAALLARHRFSYDEIVLTLLVRFPHGVAARDGWDDRTERLAKRCAFRATEERYHRFETRRAAMRMKLAELRNQFPRTTQNALRIDQ
ncbi:bifunctional DNA primase/polymerase [Sinirhodobacter sp. WL0062]|uniref:Bifunctional DNA primase/polymerase n=1 Tax=Rhodobacter flavimaris TaxID=2907145 RepID=A0ABS8YRV0_9RHOB|nr:bifunctional DNA primase/polymerase [Sinirhodobacter sp. WL0062]MCE5972607.1 bifunctional DNA primase/polymerase [Sinirhodobacter sp. WL0062]